MPQPHTDLTPARFRLRVLRALLAEPNTHTVKSLAEQMGEPYSRVYDAVRDIDAEFGTTTDKKRLTVLLPSDPLVF